MPSTDSKAKDNFLSIASQNDTAAIFTGGSANQQSDEDIDCTYSRRINTGASTLQAELCAIMHVLSHMLSFSLNSKPTFSLTYSQFYILCNNPDIMITYTSSYQSYSNSII